jgi:hypothetical protein
MGRPTISEYQVKQAAVPGDKYWYIVGRPNGKRIRAWFKTKEEAKAEAAERNIAMRKLGQNVVTLDATLAETAREAQRGYYRSAKPSKMLSTFISSTSQLFNARFRQRNWRHEYWENLNVGYKRRRYQNLITGPCGRPWGNSPKNTAILKSQPSPVHKLKLLR